MEMKNGQSKKYLVFGIAGALILGGFVYFLSSGGSDKEEVRVAESVESVQFEVKKDEVEKVDRFANIERVGFFAYDSAELNSSASTILSAWAEKLSENTGSLINIEGHCDERGSKAYNATLGTARANAVRSFLISKGIESTRLHTISFGATRPLNKGSDEGAYAQNRRFEVKEVSTFAQN